MIEVFYDKDGLYSVKGTDCSVDSEETAPGEWEHIIKDQFGRILRLSNSRASGYIHFHDPERERPARYFGEKDKEGE